MKRNANLEHKDNLSILDKLALYITTKVGTIGFFLIILTWSIVWLSWNILAPSNLQFDPYPAFVFWLFISNMIQILLMPLIMVGQNIQAKYAELRAEIDLQTDIKAEEEIQLIIEKLDIIHQCVINKKL